MTLYVKVIARSLLSLVYNSWIHLSLKFYPFFSKSSFLTLGPNNSLLTRPNNTEEQYFFLNEILWSCEGKSNRKWFFLWPNGPSLSINRSINQSTPYSSVRNKKLKIVKKAYWIQEAPMKVKASKTIKKCRRRGADCSPMAISPVLFVCLCTCIFVYVHFSLWSCPSVTRNYRFIIQPGLGSMLTLAWGRVCEREAEEIRLERSSKWWHNMKKIRKLNPKEAETMTSFTQWQQFWKL